MKQEVYEGDFIDAFRGNDTYKNNFSYEGLKALYAHFEEFEQFEEIEFDMVAICCEYSEYKSAWEAMEQYQREDMPTVDLEEMIDADGVGPDLMEVQEASEALALEWLEERTPVIKFEGGIIIQQF